MTSAALQILAVALTLTASQGFAVPRTIAPLSSSSTGRTSGSARVRVADTRLHAFCLDGALASVDNFFQTEPYLSAALTCSLKASVADWLAQSQTASESPQQAPGQEHHYNWNRNLAFIAYGGLYQGCVQTFLFGVLFPLWFPDHSLQTILTQVGIDIFLLGPLVCMPTVYTMKALFAGEEATAGLQKYVNHVQTKGILFKYWSLWGPVQALNFAVVPPHLRVFFVAMVSFFWICFLSTVSSSSASTVSEEVQQQQHPQDAFSSSFPSYPSLLPLRAVPIPVLSEAYASQHQQQEAFQFRRRRSGHAMGTAPIWARSTSS